MNCCKSKTANKKGFTLIELLVVISIIGLLASTILASLGGVRAKARDVRRLSDIKQVQLALELYFDSNTEYPPGGADPTGCGIGSCLTTLTNYLTPAFISTIPLDPIHGNTFNGYRYCRSGLDFKRYDMLVRPEDGSGWCNIRHSSVPNATSCWHNGPNAPEYGYCDEESDTF
jgi:prepilin-type N-terminal cleavage/methylation domain-containing protein